MSHCYIIACVLTLHGTYNTEAEEAGPGVLVDDDFDLLKRAHEVEMQIDLFQQPTGKLDWVMSCAHELTCVLGFPDAAALAWTRKHPLPMRGPGSAQQTPLPQRVMHIQEYQEQQSEEEEDD